MARPALKVTYNNRDPRQLPQNLTEGAALLIDLMRRGKLDELGDRLRIRRQGGYCGLDLFIWLLLYFTLGLPIALKTAWALHFRDHNTALAALAARRSMASASAVSRALGRVENDLIRPQATWMLTQLTDADELLRHPAVCSYDALGRPWHAFDLDPTVTAIRQRALPKHPELPEPLRRADQTGKPGHTGRKRGDINFRRVTVQHAGSSLWLHGHLSAGNGQGITDLEAGLDTIVGTCQRLGIDVMAVMVRLDGEYGYVPAFTACRDRRLPFITRLNRQKLFDDPAFLARLRGANWRAVPDSLSGPRRAAAELGEWRIEPGKQTRRVDGSRYEPVTVRIVASRYPKTKDGRRGKVLDGWQIELFVVDLPVEAWPAEDAVMAYFSRAGGQENRFAQEDRELGLDRIFSYHLPGQELACLVGLTLWNLRVVRGWQADPPPAVKPVQRLREDTLDERVPTGWPRDPGVVKRLGEVDWEAQLEKKPGWSFQPETGEVLCTAGRPLVLTTVRKTVRNGQRVGMILRRPEGGCQDCDVRMDCNRSPRPEAPKHAEFSIDSELAAVLRARLEEVRRTPAWSPAATSMGSLRASESLFLPAAARQLFAARFHRGQLRVQVTLPPPDPPQPRLVAVDVADRQRRRQTWEQNLARYALPEGAEVHVEVLGTPALRRMIGEPVQQRFQFAGSG